MSKVIFDLNLSLKLETEAETELLYPVWKRGSIGSKKSGTVFDFREKTIQFY